MAGILERNPWVGMGNNPGHCGSLLSVVDSSASLVLKMIDLEVGVKRTVETKKLGPDDHLEKSKKTPVLIR